MTQLRPRGTRLAIGFAASLPLLCLTDSRAEVLLDEPFDHPDGPLVETAEGRWLTQSGTPGQVEVAGTAVVLTQRESEDVRTALAEGPFAAASDAVLYLACTVRFTDLPSGAGAYFLHFKDGGTGFRGRLYASVQDAASGAFRLGVSEASNNPTLFDQDLQLETPYTVVCRYDVATAATTLWVNPSAESDPGVAAADDGTAIAIHGLALRQSLSSGNGMGSLVLDDLRVATRFEELIGAGDPRPRVVEHPSDRSVAAGETVTLTVVATGEPPLDYQWFHDGKLLPDALEGELVLPAVTAEDAGTYVVVVSNGLGSATSEAAVLVVQDTPDSGPGSIAWTADADGWLTLRWPGEFGWRYSILGATAPDGPWTVLAAGLENPEFSEPMMPTPGASYYRVVAER